MPKFKMNAEQRKEYFAERLNNDACIYLMDAVSKIVELTDGDYYDICRELGMCNSEALDFLDAYKNEEGWEDDDEGWEDDDE